MGGGHRPAGRAHAVGGRRRGVDAAVCGHVGPGAGGGGGAGDVEQRGVSAVRGAVGQAPAVVSSRPLGELDLRVVCIDGKVFRDHCMVVALGIDTQGRKHVLGLREGATETAAVASGLLSDLVTRGLPTDRTLLFVIDGAPGLRRAISDVFGSRGVVHRCQLHKLRNVLGHLPERLHASVGKALRDAWDLESADRAARVLKRLAGSLELDHPGAGGVHPGGP